MPNKNKQAPNYLNGFDVADFYNGAGAQAKSLVGSPLVQSGLAAQKVISKNIAAPALNALQRSVNPVVNTLMNPGSQLLAPTLKKVGVPAGIAGVAGTLGDFASPGGKVKGLSLLEKVRAPALLHIFTDGGHTVQAIRPKDFKIMQALVDRPASGGKDLAQRLQNNTGFSFHLSPNDKVSQIISQGAVPLEGYAIPAAIKRLAAQPRNPVTERYMPFKK